MARFRPTLVPLDERSVPTTLPLGFSESLVTGGLNSPTAMAVAPDGRVFVTEQGGAVRVVQDGALLPTPFTNLTVDSSGERGLLGIALDPNFATNGLLYVYHTVPANPMTSVPAFNQVTRFTANGNVAVPGSAVNLLSLDGLSTATNHNGGAIQFGPDGKLYVAVGENGIGANSQSLNNRLGKILRINPDATLPPDNPTGFAGINGSPTGMNRAIWAVGLRNPFTFAFQPGTGRMYINDVGGARFEEIDEGRAGANYGWPATEGTFDPAAFPNFTEPVFAYAHGSGSPTVGNTIVGAAFYNPPAIRFPGDYVGDYFFADFTGNWINRLDPATGQVTNFADDLTGTFPVGLATTPTGDLLYLARVASGSGSTGGLYAVHFAVGGPSLSIGPGAGRAPEVATFDPTTGSATGKVPVFDPGFAGGVRVATADVTGDRIPDVVAAAGPGGGPRVEVLDGATGAVVKDFFAFESTFTGGSFVAAADLDRDGFADLVISPDQGGGPRVRVLSGRTGATIADFFAFETTFTGGVRTAVGDLDGNGSLDLLVSAGFGGGPRIAEFDGRDLLAGKPVPGRIVPDFFAFENTLRNGAFVAANDLDGDGYADQIIGAGPGGAPRVRVFSARTGAALADFFAGDTAARGGVTVAATTVAAGTPGFATGPGPGGRPRALGFALVNGQVTQTHEYPAFEDTFSGGIYVG